MWGASRAPSDALNMGTAIDCSGRFYLDGRRSLAYGIPNAEVIQAISLEYLSGNLPGIGRAMILPRARIRDRRGAWQGAGAKLRGLTAVEVLLRISGPVGRMHQTRAP